jgi:hypothetical protein
MSDDNHEKSVLDVFRLGEEFWHTFTVGMLARVAGRCRGRLTLLQASRLSSSVIPQSYSEAAGRYVIGLMEAEESARLIPALKDLKAASIALSSDLFVELVSRSDARDNTPPPRALPAPGGGGCPC